MDGKYIPPNLDDKIDITREYQLGSLRYSDLESNDEEVFMTAIVRFEEDGAEIDMMEKFNRSEGIEAIEHLLETECQDELRTLFKEGVDGHPEYALDAYEKIAESDQRLAHDLLNFYTQSRLDNDEVGEKMRNMFFSNCSIYSEEESYQYHLGNNTLHRDY